MIAYYAKDRRQLDLGDLVRLPDGCKRIVVATESATEHRYLGFRLARSLYGNKRAIGMPLGSRSRKSLYWVRADKVRPLDGRRGGRPAKAIGRPKR